MQPLAVIPKLPTLFSRCFLNPRRQPLLASYKVTYHCNLRCHQCPFYLMDAPDPTFEQAAVVLDSLYQRGSRLVVIEGGEPLLWRDGGATINDLVNYARRKFYCVGMTTNGTLPLNVPTDVLWVSIDGLGDTHNRLRNADIFDRIIHNIKASNHSKLFAHITINNQNVDEVPELIEYLQSLVRGITVQFYYPYNQQDALFLDFPRREALLTDIIAMKKQGAPILNSISALQALKRNTWRCRDLLIDNANPDGSISQGCYLRGRSDIDCACCGFSPHTEISLACQANLQAVWAGLKVFFLPA